VPISQSLKTDRPLSVDERTLVVWLLDHGSPRAKEALSQVPDLRVASKCECGCASVDFSVKGQVPWPRAGMEIVSDFWWRTHSGHLCGAFVFLRGELLAGLDLWSIDGEETPTQLPRTEDLRPYDVSRDT